MSKSDEKYMETRQQMGSAISEFYKAAIIAGINKDYIIDDIIDSTFNATDEEIKLVEE